MNCITCGKALSLRMVHCTACGTPVSYMTSAQSAPSQLSNITSYENYAQPLQDIHGGEYYTQVQQPMNSPYASASQNALIAQAPKKRRWDGLFLLVIVTCVLLLLSMGAYKLVAVADKAHTPTQANTPSGNALVASASAILKNGQTSSDIDGNLVPTQITQTFMANQKVYMTFTIHSGKQDGYIEAKWYADGQVVADAVLPHIHGNTRGVFSNVYITATPDGAVELYWCVQADCKDAQLAQASHFVVTPVETAYINSRFYTIVQHFSRLHLSTLSASTPRMTMANSVTPIQTIRITASRVA